VLNVGAGGSIVSTDTISQITDPLPSWVAESQVGGEPPAKLAKTEGRDEQSSETVVMEDDSLSVDSAVERPREDLQRVMTEATLVAQGCRTRTIAYARKKPTTTGMPVRKSARFTGVQAGTPTMEKAMRRAEAKDLDGECNKNVEEGNDFSVLDVLSYSHISSI
jgi:hypothetical protein